mmetsp:Transcript_4965/g.10684  ORF Transcript_4965/g.10684 Transcript_4965/m.10684 type:complete len:710 (+) Transcript_4965:238-2367(+)|eukprot:CAMPEP_0202892768 /NCGR_PEP_ID=MMETSP1392-20130828/2464_1 /ASSEMBLY_ACC=CAM_ASM_000868 /TAXON_ID=225041 /ORGANISM="Chlamydomonas chlamydogama, Strain SAG 11-48b" /LENGTH=709 /DNA_ID=CAMNT_0049576843 /DNA_START=166 /DNA_END=2295 /DNA_ORIENTATION=+
MQTDDFAQAAEIIQGRFYFACVKRPDSLRTSHIAATNICYCIDDELLYEPFFADFGPLNLGKTYRFCRKTQELLQEAERSKKRLYYYCGPHAHHKANAAVLIGIYQVLFLNRSTEEAYKPLVAFKPFVPFRDASCGVSTFHLTVLDCVKGIQKARDVGFIDWNSGNSTWSVEEYEHYEQVENGDLNWILPGKLVAFSGPAARPNEIVGYRLFTPEDYWDYYKRKGVTAVVRLNKKVYDRRRFTDGGFRHYDMYFPDGSCPTEAILMKFLEVAENEPGALAIHCKAGLGRTGVLICCYIMKHYRFTAEEVIGYIRVCRPGSVIGPQQNFLRDVEARMWHEGDMYRQARGMSKGVTGLGMHDMVLSGRPAAVPADGDAAGPVPMVTPPAGYVSSYRGAATAAAAAAGVGTPAAGYSSRQPISNGVSNGVTNPSDMSLLQYRMYNGPGSGGNGGILSSAGSTNSALGLYGGGANGGSGIRNSQSNPRSSYSQRSITPLRYSANAPPSIAVPGYNSVANSIMANVQQQQYGHSAGGPQTPTSGGNTPTGRPSLLASYGGMPVSRSMPSMPSRAPSADRSVDRTNVSALRATLHTDTLRAADRPRVVPERNTQSADISNSWRVASGLQGSSGATRPMAAPASNAQSKHSAVARTLAPNGQPRKVPVAMLPQYHASLAGSRSHGIMVSGNSAPASPDSNGRIKSVAQLRHGLHSK